MEQPLPDRLMRSIPELKYVNADNVARYRVIMRYFYEEYKRLRYWMKPEEVYEGIMRWGVLPDYTPEQCMADLEQLEEWGNLASRHDAGRATTLEEYMRKKMQYLLKPYSIEIERMLETLEKVTGYGGSLEPTLFDSIADKLFAIRRMDWENEPGAALELWTSLHDAFKRLHENAADYIASMQTAKAEEMMVTESFLLYKDRLTHYLQNFIQALQRSAYSIEGNLEQIPAGLRDMFLERVADEELARPRLEDTPDKDALIAELRQGWMNLDRWFRGDGHASSELMLLERATKDAIARVVRSVIRLQERKRSGISRKKELEYLADWFARTERLEDAHKLAGLVFGLFRTRHLQGEDLRESDRSDRSMWEETPTVRTLRSRSRKRLGRQETEPVPDHAGRQRREREAYLRRQAEERAEMEALVRRGGFAVSELGYVPSSMRLRLLNWIGRCNAAPRHSFMTPEGVVITVTNPRTERRTVLRSEDGELELPDYEFVFTMQEPLWTVAVSAEGGRGE